MTGLYIDTNASSFPSQNSMQRNMDVLLDVLTRLRDGLLIDSIAVLSQNTGMGRRYFGLAHGLSPKEWKQNQNPPVLSVITQ